MSPSQGNKYCACGAVCRHIGRYNDSPSPTPITTGGPKRAATILSGSAAERTPAQMRRQSLHRRRRPLREQSVRLRLGILLHLFNQVSDDLRVGLVTNLCLAGSAHVSVRDSFRRCRYAPPRCALCSRDADAHFLPSAAMRRPRVCPMPNVPSTGSSRSTSSRLASLPGARRTSRVAVPAATAIPAESYPILSRRKPSMMTEPLS